MDIEAVKKAVEQDDEGVTVTIFQRTGEPYLGADGSEATVTVVGTESSRYRQAERRQQRKMFKRVRVRGADITPEDAESEAIDLAASAVIDWHGWELDGKPVPCEPKYVKQVLQIKHIFEQVQSAIQGHAAFFGEKSKG
jgi:hypothetical protein